MRRIANTVLILLLMLAAPAGNADPPPEAVPIPDAEIPPPPDPVESGEPIEPEVTIVQRKDATIEEYRLNGRLYMIKITPVVGKPYYLIDNNGDGVMESRMSNIYNVPIVPQWVILSW